MNYNNKKYYSTFLLICLLLIIFAILKKNYLYKDFQKEHFISFGLNNHYSNLKNMLSLSDFDYTTEHAKNKKIGKKMLKGSKKIGKKSFKGSKNIGKKNSKSSENQKKNMKGLINREIKTAISSINMPAGQQGPQGPPGPAGGLFQNKGYLTSNLNIKEMRPEKMTMALKPIGNMGSPVLLAESDYSSDRKWMMNPDGTITNQYLGNKYCLSLNQDNSTDSGKYSLLELVNSDNANCTQFYEDNNSRLKIKNTNNCMTVKNTSSMEGLNLSIPNTNKCSFSEISNSECKIEDDTQVLGVDICNNIIKPEQTFVWL